MFSATFKKLKITQTTPTTTNNIAVINELHKPLLPISPIRLQVKRQNFINTRSPTPPPTPRAKKTRSFTNSNNNNKKRRPEPVKFTFSSKDIARSQKRPDLTVTITDPLPPPPPLKKQKTAPPHIPLPPVTSNTIFDSDFHESTFTNGISNSLSHLFTFKTAWWDNTLKQYVYKDCTLIRFMDNIGNPGTFVSMVCVEPTKARVTFNTIDGKYWRLKMGFSLRECKLVVHPPIAG